MGLPKERESQSGNPFFNVPSQRPQIERSINQSNGSSKKSASAIAKLSGGDQSKTGPGARAKADALRNKGKTSGLGLGVDGYNIPHAYHVYHRAVGTQAKSPMAAHDVPGEGDSPPRIAPTLSPKKQPSRQARIQSKPLRIKSPYQDKEVEITKKDIRKWIQDDEFQYSANAELNQQRLEDECVDIIQNPDEVVSGIDIHHRQKECQVHIKKIKLDGETEQRVAVIADSKTGRGYLSSTLNDDEYNTLKSTGNIDLSDLRRDPQTLVKNPKSVQEADALSRAKSEGALEEFSDIRRPFNVSESNRDFVGKDSKGSKIEIEMKGIDQSGRRPIDRQTQDINTGITEFFATAQDPSKCHVICDLAPSPGFMQGALIKNITRGLKPDQLNNITFLLF